MHYCKLTIVGSVAVAKMSILLLATSIELVGSTTFGSLLLAAVLAVLMINNYIAQYFCVDASFCIRLYPLHILSVEELNEQPISSRCQ